MWFKKDNSRAKEIFWEYGGSHFFMTRSDPEKYTEYSSYNVSKKQEYEWIQEYQEELLIDIKNNDNDNSNVFMKFGSLCSSIQQYLTLDCLKELAELAFDKKEVLDTFSVLLIAEDILRTVDSLKKDNLGNHKNIIIAQRTAIDILKWLLERPVTIAPEYYNKPYTSDMYDHQNIIDRINNKLKKWSK